MKKSILAFVLTVTALSSVAMANVTLVNKDSSKHDITTECSSGTVQTSIDANVSRSIGKGPCEVTIKGTNSSAKVNDGGTITIVSGKAN